MKNTVKSYVFSALLSALTGLILFYCTADVWLSLIVSLVFLCSLFMLAWRTGDLRKKMREMEKLIDMQNAQYTALEVFRDIFRSAWHDFKNHTTCILGFMESGDTDSAKKYVSSIADSVGAVPQCMTGNLAFDCILSAKIRKAQEMGIGFSYRLNLPSHIGITPVDLTVILSNVLDNAIEACERLGSADKIITLDVGQKSDMLFLRVANTADLSAGARKQGVFHGMGLKNVEAALAKYHGHMEAETSVGEYVLRILIKYK